MKNRNYSVLGIKAEVPTFWGRARRIFEDNSVELFDGKIIKPKNGDIILDNGQTRTYSSLHDEWIIT